MTDLERKRVNQLVSIGDIQDGDVLVGERTDGTTVRITYAAPTGVSDGDKGDITVSSTGTAWTIDNDAVTYAKIQNVSDTDKLLGRSSSGAGDIEEITCTSAGRALIDDLDAAAQRTTLGLGTLATQSGTFSGTSSGTNTGDQTSIVGITGTKAQFDTACTDGNFLYSGDVTQYTDELAQDAIGAMIDSSLTYVDATPLLQRAALTGDVTAAAGSNATTIATPSSATIAVDDKVIIKDTSASDATKYVLTQAVADLCLNTSGNYVSGGTDVAVADGGTGRSTATAYAPIVGGTSSTGAFQSTASGSTGQILQSAGNASIPTWSTPTYPSSSGTSGKFLISDGTNNVYSTSTIPTSAGATALKYLRSDGTNYILSTATISDSPSTAGKILISDGTNWITSTPTFPNTSATSGKRIKSDGTNWVTTSTTMPDSGTSRKMIVGDGTNYVESSETWPVPSTSGKIMQSDGTNWTSAAPTGTGTPVLATSPTLVTPDLGAATATSINFGQVSLNYYDEGTYTPTFTFATAGDLSVSYAAQTGFYRRVGTMVYVVTTLVFTPTFTTASGQARLGALPFTSANINHGVICAQKSSNVTFPASCTQVFGYTANTTYFTLRAYGTSTAQTDLTTSNFTSGASHTLVVSGMYLI